MVQQSLALITASSLLGVGSGSPVVGVLMKARRSHPAAHAQTLSSCQGGYEYSDDPISATTDVLTEEVFYDSACTEPQSLSQLTLRPHHRRRRQ